MILVLGKGIANDGVVLLLKEEGMDYEYLDINEVKYLNYEYIIKAPGIPLYNEVIQRAFSLSIKVMTDIEFGMMLRKRFYIGITGSNGKTTTSSLINHILKNKYKTVLCGNIGYSFCEALVKEDKDAIFIVEMSSFQLENSYIDLDISVILNINPCHLDHHKSYTNYYNSKLNICLNQNDNHFFVYNYNDVLCRKISKNTNAKILSFSVDNIFCDGFIKDNIIYYNNKKIFDFSKSNINRLVLKEDVLASICVCLLFPKIKKKTIYRSLKKFNEIEFRFNKINNFIYNDAKSTNPYSTVEAIKELDNIFLICGGYDRNEDLGCLRPYLIKLKKVFAYGMSRDKIYNFMIDNNVDCIVYENLDKVLIDVFKFRKEEVILFSPMFASFDQYKNYIERGNHFNKLCKDVLNKKNTSKL